MAIFIYKHFDCTYVQKKHAVGVRRMPYGDCTGPDGQGPMTGRRRGYRAYSRGRGLLAGFSDWFTGRRSARRDDYGPGRGYGSGHGYGRGSMRGGGRGIGCGAQLGYCPWTGMPRGWRWTYGYDYPYGYPPAPYGYRPDYYPADEKEQLRREKEIWKQN